MRTHLDEKKAVAEISGRISFGKIVTFVCKHSFCSQLYNRKKVSSPYYTGNDRLLWLGAHEWPAALLPTPVMPEQMSNYLNVVKGKIRAATCHYKVVHKV